MAYFIQPIHQTNPEQYPLYFLDANVWVAHLEQHLHTKYNQQYTPYANFVEGIVALNLITEPKLLKKIKYQPKIAVNSLLISEILNVYLRHAFTQYQKNYPNAIKYKEDYRPTSHYQNALKTVQDNFALHAEYLRILDDKFSEMDYFENFMLSSNYDFNDYFYYQWAKKHQIPIVTDDADFLFEDVVIITANHRLLKHK